MKKEIDWKQVIADIKSESKRGCSGIRNGKKCGNKTYSKWNGAGIRYCLKCKSKESITAHTAFHRLRVPINILVQVLEEMRDNYDGPESLYLSVYDKNDHNDNRKSTTELASTFDLNRKTISRFLSKAASYVSTTEKYKELQEPRLIDDNDKDVKTNWFSNLPGDVTYKGQALSKKKIIDKYERLYYLLFEKESFDSVRAEQRETYDIIYKLVTKKNYKKLDDDNY